MVIYFCLEHNCDEAGSERKADDHIVLALINATTVMDDFGSDELIEHLLILLKHLTALVFGPVINLQPL